MLKRQIGYVMLACFVAVMVGVLMLDDPATRQAEMLAFGATLQAERPLVLFPEVTDPAEIDGIEVLDVTTGKGILVMRDMAGAWYAPDIPDVQQGIAAQDVNQQVIESAAAAIKVLATPDWYDATTGNLALFGLQPEPAYRFRFRGHDAADRTYEAIVDIGAANPDNMAYYVYVNVTSGQNQRIYLINKQIVDIVLNMLTETRLTPTSDEPPANGGTATPVP
jgi:hypothetical protein